MRRVITIIGLFLVLSLVLSGCFNLFLMKGYVINKHYTPAHSSTRWVTTYHRTCYSTNHCTTTSESHLRTYYYPQEWDVTINECPAGTTPHGDEHCDGNMISVSPQMYDRIVVGNWYDFSQEN